MCFAISQSYTGYEPTSMRAIRARYHPYVQARARVDQLRRLGHSVDKVHSPPIKHHGCCTMQRSACSLSPGWCRLCLVGYMFLCIFVAPAADPRKSERAFVAAASAWQ